MVERIEADEVAGSSPVLTLLIFVSPINPGKVRRTMNALVHRTKRFITRNAPTILTCASAAGVVVTTVMAVKAAPKALTLLEQAKEEKGEELTVLEKANVAAPVYIPTIIVGVSTIACIVGANMLSKRQQASLASAYALLDSSYKDYKKKVAELYDDSVDQKIKAEIAKDKYDEEEPIVLDDGEELFYDEFSGRYFNATLYTVQHAEYQLNRDIQTQGHASLNDFYEYLGIDPIDGGDALGWSEGGNLAHYWQDWVDFNHHKAVLDDGLECCILSFFEEPFLDYDGYA